MAWDGKDRSVAGLIATNGGFVPAAVGCTFAGKKPGEWRRIRRLENGGRTVYWLSTDFRSGCCKIKSFLCQIDRSRLVALPGEELRCDFLHSTIKRLREKGYSKEHVMAAVEDLW